MLFSCKGLHNIQPIIKNMRYQHNGDEFQQLYNIMFVTVPGTCVYSLLDALTNFLSGVDFGSLTR